jgi:hypothetical protein
MRENKADFGIVISEDTLSELKQDDKTIWIIPAWLFILVNWRNTTD